VIKESRTPAGWIIFFSFTISFFTLIIYLTEKEFSDEELFLLLAILRYSSFTVCICSIYFFITGIISLVKKRTLLLILQVIFSVLGVIYGACIILVEAFITVITGG